MFEHVRRTVDARPTCHHLRETAGQGTPVARPTRAVRLSDDEYRLLATPDYDPCDEKWEFLPGSIVAAERQRWSSGEIMVAVDRRQQSNRGGLGE